MEWATLKRSGWVHRDDVDIFWQAWLPPTPPVAKVVLHHGVAEHGGRYPHAVHALVAAGYGVFALDARGHGRSGRRARFNRFGELVADLGAVVDEVAAQSPQAPIYLMGYSLGGAVAVAYALQRQNGLAGAIIIGSALGRGSSVSRLQFEAASLFSAVAPWCPLIRLRASDMTQDAEVVSGYDNDPLVHHGRLAARAIAEMAAAIRYLPGEFGKLHLPLLLLHGAADITASPQGSQGLLEGAGSPDKTLVLYEGRRHDLLNEPGNRQVTRDIVRWLDARCC